MAGGIWLTDMNGIFFRIWPKYSSKPRPDVYIYECSFKALNTCTYRNFLKSGKMLGVLFSTNFDW